MTHSPLTLPSPPQSGERTKERGNSFYEASCGELNRVEIKALSREVNHGGPLSRDRRLFSLVRIVAG